MMSESPEEQKNKIRKKRDAAFFGTLDIDSDDGTRELLKHDGKLHAITLKKIIRLNTPDDLDPDLKFSDVPTTQDVILELGSRSPIVARTILQMTDAGPFSASQKERERLLDISWDVI